jgi:putative endonuclease
LLHSPRPCHLEQVRRSEATECASKDPENTSSATLIRGVLPKLRVLRFSACTTASITSSGSTFSPARSGTLDIGITGFFEKRIHQHKYDSIEGFTKKYKCPRLVDYESYQDVEVAISREKQIKRWRREKKITLIEKMNPRWQDIAENWGREMRFREQSLGRTP